MNLKGIQGWDWMYKKQFGEERWKRLRTCLKSEVNFVAFISPFLSSTEKNKVILKHNLVPCNLPNCFVTCRNNSSHSSEVPPSSVNSSAVCHASVLDARSLSFSSSCINQHDSSTILDESYDNLKGDQYDSVYFMDGASAIAAFALDLKKEGKVLDMCAGPGGKALILANRIFFPYLPGSCDNEAKRHRSVFVCNEIQHSRKIRLMKVIQTHLPSILTNSSCIRFSSADAVKENAFLSYGGFDSILLDVPCSSDRHLLKQGNGTLSQWSANGVKKHALRQLNIIESSLRFLKKNGTILYCTCALSVQENDIVIEKVLKKYAKKVKILSVFSEEQIKEFNIKVVEFNSSLLHPSFTSTFPSYLTSSSSPYHLASETSSSDNSVPTISNCSFQSIPPSSEKLTAKEEYIVEKTNYGMWFLPDISGYGPLYMSKLTVV